jgi:AcrR family transcriptional regulator
LDLAERAGLSIGAIYHHFKNKDELLRFLHASLVANLLDEQVERLERLGDNADRVDLVSQLIDAIGASLRPRRQVLRALTIHSVEDPITARVSRLYRKTLEGKLRKLLLMHQETRATENAAHAASVLSQMILSGVLQFLCIDTVDRADCRDDQWSSFADDLANVCAAYISADSNKRPETPAVQRKGSA